MGIRKFQECKGGSSCELPLTEIVVTIKGYIQLNEQISCAAAHYDCVQFTVYDD